MLEVVFQALYHVGIIGVKLEPHLPRQWSPNCHIYLKGKSNLRRP
jgi:hypothetical protein